MNLRSRMLCGVVVVLLGGACGGGTPPTMTAADPLALLNGDLADLDRETTAIADSIKAYDTAQRGYFSKVFGGPSKANTRVYFNERIRIFATIAELSTDDWKVRPGSFRNNGWTKDPEAEQKQKEAGGVTGAANIGTGLWFAGAVDKVDVVIINKGKEIPVTSPRVGFMALGEGYVASVKNKSGQTIVLPAEYRQSILMHEARHSDCPGGVSQADLDVVRKATSAQIFNDTYARRTCGHLHVRCPTGHPFAGLAACDDVAWGAYSVGALYGAAVVGSLSGNDKAILESVLLDFWGRNVGITKEDILAGKQGEPDMSSSGIR